jgi:hypothetical protein
LAANFITMSKAFKTTALAVLAAGVLFTSCNSGNSSATANGDAVALKFKLLDGSKYLYTTDITNQTNTMGQNISNKMLMEFTYDVTAGENENKDLVVTYTRVKMDMNAMGQTMSYDSNDSANANPMFKALGNMIGKSFTTTVAPNGTIVKVEGIESLVPEGTQGLDQETLKQTMQTSFNVFPEKPVKVGESWTKTTDMKLQNFNMKLDSKYTLDKVEGDNAIISMDGKISSEAGASVQGMEMNLDGTQTGKLEIDIPTGQAISGDIKQLIKGKFNANGQEIPMDISSDVKISSKKL